VPYKYELIVWDWDGTLMDSTPTIVQCIQQACVDLELPVPDDSLASHVIGLGVQDALRIAVPSVRVDQHPRWWIVFVITIWLKTMSYIYLQVLKLF